MEPLHVVQLYQTPILEQLKLEEALLRADQHNWCLINEGSPSAIVMGISGKAQELIHQDKWIQKPLPIIRRFSGGGTVLIDENTYVVTFICNTSFAPVHPFPEHIMRWTEALYAPLFSPHPFKLQENDYTLNNQKCGGNAQSICKNRWLHHSTFLWDYCPQSMDYLLLPKRMPQYRRQRSHTDFLCRLKDIWPSKQTFRFQLTRHLQANFSVKELTMEEIEHIVHLPHRKATSLMDTMI